MNGYLIANLWLIASFFTDSGVKCVLMVFAAIGWLVIARLEDSE